MGGLPLPGDFARGGWHCPPDTSRADCAGAELLRALEVRLAGQGSLCIEREVFKMASPRVLFC